MDFFQFISKYGWLLFIAFTFLVVFQLKKTSSKHIIHNPNLEPSYKNLIKGVILFYNIPWFIMGFGNLTQMTHSIFEYFNPKLLNPVVLTFHVVLVLLWILNLWWIYAKKGAEFLEKHPGLIQISSFNGKRNVSAKQIKLLAPLMILGGLITMILMWTGYFDVPLNNLKQLTW